MANVDLGYRVLHQHGDLSPRAAEYTLLLREIANEVLGSARSIRRQAKAVDKSSVSLRVASPRRGEKGKQSVASFLGNVIDVEFKRAVAKAQKSGRLQGLRIIETAVCPGPRSEKKGPDFVLDDERVAWDITSAASVTGHYERDVRGNEESWVAYIVFPY